MYTLFGYKNSGSAAVEIALNLVGVDYQQIDAATWDTDSALQELEKFNPLKQIPTLILPDNTILTESAAILIDLGLKFPHSGLLPTNSAARAQTVRGLVFLAANCYSNISIIDYPERWLENERLSVQGLNTKLVQEMLREGSRRQLHKNWGIFATSFPVFPYFCGERLGALDILAAVVSRWSGTRKYLQEHYPSVHEVMEKIENSEICAAVFRKHFDS